MELPVSMPGSFLPDYDHPAEPTLTKANARPPVFLPPTSQSASTSLSRSFYNIPRTVSGLSHGSRKRARYDVSSDLTLITPSGTRQNWINVGEDSTSTLLNTYSPIPSPDTLTSTHYRLAGGLDRPANAIGLLASYDGEEDSEFEQEYRPARFSHQAWRDPDGYFPPTPAVVTGAKKGRKGAHPSPDGLGWSDAVYRLFGGMINFWWNNAFRGFHAGNDRAYPIKFPQIDATEHNEWTEEKGMDDVFGAKQSTSTSMSSQFPEDNLVTDYMSHPYTTQSNEQAVSTEYDLNGPSAQTSSLQRNWILVKGFNGESRADNPGCAAHDVYKASTKPQLRPVSGNAWSSRPGLTPSRPSSAGAPGLESNRPASYASPRAGTQKPASPKRLRSSGSHRQFKPSPRRSEGRGGLTATRSYEVQVFEKRVREKEKAQNESMQRFTRQLQDMIREGKQALGTRIDIEDEENTSNEGYVEGRDFIGPSTW